MTFTSYNQVNEYLGKKDDRPYPYGKSTRVMRIYDGYIVIRYHNTNVVAFTPSHMYLFSGGFHTDTTLRRINDCLPKDHVLWSHKNMWYFRDGSLFEEGVSLTYEGEWVNTMKQFDVKQAEKRYRDIKKYAKAYLDAFENCQIDWPGEGNCFSCNAFYSTGQHMFGHYHMAMHIAENDFSPSLLPAVIKHAWSVSKSMQQWVAHITSRGRVDTWFNERARVEKLFKRFLSERAW